MHYIALVHKEKKSDYGISFPDFPGCVTAVKSQEQAISTAQEALIEHIQLLRELNEEIPFPSSLEEILLLPESKEAVALLIDIPPQSSVRVNITIPKDVLALIDCKAANLHLSRSAFLVNAAIDYQKRIGKISR